MPSISRGGEVEDATITHEEFDEELGPKALSDDEVSGILDQHIQRAVNFCFDQLGIERNEAMRAYLGLPEGVFSPPSIQGRSQAMSTDVSDTIEWMLPPLLAIFTAGPSVVEFVPRKEGDEDAAEQATEYLNYLFYQQNPGWSELYTWFKDALIQKVGIMKVWFDRTPEVVSEFYRGLTELQFTDLLEDDTVEPLEHTAYPDPAALHAQEAQYAQAVESYSRQQAMISTLTGAGFPQRMAEEAAAAANMQHQNPQALGATMDPQQQAKQQATQRAQQQRQAQSQAQQQAAAKQQAQQQQEDSQVKQQLGQAPAQPPQPPGMPGMQPPGAPGAPQGGPQGGPPQPPQQPPGPPPLPLIQEPKEPNPSTLPQLHDVRLKRTKAGGKVRVAAVPGEEFIIDPDIAHPRDGFSGHRKRVTVSWLRQMGYPNVDDITSDEEVGLSNGQLMNDARYALQDRGNTPYIDETGQGDETMREVWLTECYLPIDVNGDGIAEWRKITRAGNALLDNEPCDGPPWATLCPVPIPHVFFGRSEADLALPSMVIKTAVLRNALDNLAFQTNARTFAVENMVNLDDLLTNRPGGVVRMKQPGMAGALAANAGDPAANFQMLQYADDMKQDATGITKYTQGSDADTLNKTAAGLQNITNRADARVELVARIFAETGVKDLFWLMLKLAAQYQDKPAVVRLTGKWVNVDPREWFNRFDMQVNVGLGTGNKDQAVAHLQQIMQLQQAAVQAGFATPKNMYNTAAKLCGVLGFKDADQFFTDPDTLPPAPPAPPDPTVQAITQQTQATLQIEAAKNQTDKDKALLQAQIDSQKQDKEDSRERDKTAAEMAIQREELLFKYGVHPMYEGITFISTFNQSNQALGGDAIARPNMAQFNGVPGVPSGVPQAVPGAGGPAGGQGLPVPIPQPGGM